MEELHVSVRALVEFTLHGEDLTGAAADRERMLEGGRAHRARQGEAGGDLRGYEAEVPLSLCVDWADALRLKVSGRADGVFEADGLTCVEEIKLWDGAPLGDALPAHRAQAACYAHMLCASRGLTRARMDVLYADRHGRVLHRFTQTQEAQALAQAFAALVEPYARWQEAMLRWRRERDEALSAFTFPYAAFREGQRLFSGNVFVAIRDRRRLLAQAPTGTGKTAAALFPALKALAAGHTNQIFYLTARTTGRALALSTAAHFHACGAKARVLELTAREKICPMGAQRRCDPAYCPGARGFFNRLPDALSEMLRAQMWDRAAVQEMAARHDICPFEFSLSLAEIADVVVCDYNYAFDPAARIQRVFQQRTDLSLLVDEAHNLVDRARDMLSACLDGTALRAVRREYGKQHGRKNAVYRALTRTVRRLSGLEAERGDGVWRLEAPPPELLQDAQGLCDALGEALARGQGALLGETFQGALAYVQTSARLDDAYAVLLERAGRDARLRLLCLDAAPYLRAATARLRGVVYFSATLSPMAQMRALLGGEEGDGLLSLPSPFPPERLHVVRLRVDTRYARREQTARQVAEAIAAMARARRGNYLALFPSYAYMRLVRAQFEQLAPDVQTVCQESGMDEAARDDFIARFAPGGCLTGFCVMGGVFAEGVDLPGDRLLGVAAVGVGLPQVCPEREALREHFDQEERDGFALAYRIPGMVKVLQAVGRVIRTERDRGVALLIDARFFQGAYSGLLPEHFFPLHEAVSADDLARRLDAFWRAGNG